MGRRDETITILADDDSYGPTPPPPPYPHPDDIANDAEVGQGGGARGAGDGADADDAGLAENVGGAPTAGGGSKKKSWMLGFAGRSRANESRNEVQIQGIEDVLKDDPPADRTAESFDDKDLMVRRDDHRNRRGDAALMDDTDNDGEDLSVEIPPTTVVQRMAHDEEVDEVKRADNGKWTKMGAVVACLVVVLAIILGVGYGTGAFQAQSASGGGGSGGSGGGGSSDPNRPAAVSSYLLSISTQGTNATGGGSNTNSTGGSTNTTGSSTNTNTPTATATAPAAPTAPTIPMAPPAAATTR
jgi:hypothetical protein